MGEWLYGINAVGAALSGRNRTVHEIWIRHGANRRLAEIASQARDKGLTVRHVERQQLLDLGLERAQGVAARCSRFRYREEGELADLVAHRKSAIVVVLDHVQDPQNLGAILRTAEVAGACGVCIPKRRAAAVTPAAVRASAGASEHLAVVRIANVARAIRQLKRYGVWSIGLEPNATNRWYEIDCTGAVAIVVGSEGVGLRRSAAQACDFLVALPAAGQVGSLNASAAFAAVAFEVVRQQADADATAGRSVD